MPVDPERENPIFHDPPVTRYCYSASAAFPFVEIRENSWFLNL